MAPKNRLRTRLPLEASRICTSTWPSWRAFSTATSGLPLASRSGSTAMSSGEPMGMSATSASLEPSRTCSRRPSATATMTSLLPLAFRSPMPVTLRNTGSSPRSARPRRGRLSASLSMNPPGDRLNDWSPPVWLLRMPKNCPVGGSLTRSIASNAG